MRRFRDNLALRINQQFFYGWVILAVGTAGMFASGPAQSHSFGVFVGPIGADLGLSKTAVASAYASATLLAALGLPFMGRLIDRFGARRMVFIVAGLLGFACVGFGAVANLLWLTLGFAALRYLGQGSLMLNSSNIVSHWFDRRRGFALGLMTLGFAVSMGVHPPLAQWLIDTVGWRQAWVWLGVLTWLLMLPIIVVFVHDRPEDLGLKPDGDTPAERSGDRAEETRQPDLVGLTLKQTVRTSAFYIITVCLFVFSMTVTCLHFFQVSILAAHGLSAQLAARVFTVTAVTMVMFMPLVGRMLDRFRTEHVFAGALIVTSAALFAATLVSDVPSALAYAVVFGISNATGITLYAYVWPRYFGRRHLGSIQGFGQMVGVIGASVGPLPLGIAFDLVGSYNEMLLILAVLPLICAVLALFLRMPAPPPGQTGAWPG